jgi:hypothetical protein
MLCANITHSYTANLNHKQYTLQYVQFLKSLDGMSYLLASDFGFIESRMKSDDGEAF